MRYTKQSANYVAKTAASQLPAGVAGKVNGVITQMLDFKRLLRSQLSALANKEAQASIMWLLHKLRDALLRKKGKRAAIVPPAGAKGGEGQSGHAAWTHQQAGTGAGNFGLQELPAPARKGASISLATGNESFTHTDFVLAAPLAIEWARTYASDLDAFDRGSLGARWITPYSMRVDVATPVRGTPGTGELGVSRSRRAYAMPTRCWRWGGRISMPSKRSASRG